MTFRSRSEDRNWMLKGPVIWSSAAMAAAVRRIREAAHVGDLLEHGHVLLVVRHDDLPLGLAGEDVAVNGGQRAARPTIAVPR